MNLKFLTRTLTPYLLLLALLLAGIGTFYWSEPLEILRALLAEDRYWLSIISYTIMTALAVVVAPLTVALTIPFMASIFGSFAIFVSVWIGWILGSVVVFWISRSYGKSLVERLFSLERIENIERKMPKHLDFSVLLLLRMFIPVDVLSYAVGLFSTISFAKYITATAIGIVPFAFIFTYGPDALTGESMVLLFSFLALVCAVLSALAVFYFSEFMRPRVRIYTHNGKFHTDDVFAVATVQLILDLFRRRYKVIRTRDPLVLQTAKEHARASQNDDVFVVDVSEEYDAENNIFDHHQYGGAGERANRAQYAAFGLVWKKYGQRLTSTNAAADKFDQDFVQAIDAPDNGQELYTQTDLQVDPITLHRIIEQMYRQADITDALGQDADFADAVAFAKQLIGKALVHAEKKVLQEKKAGVAYNESENKRLIVTEDYLGRNSFIKYDQVQLVVSPRGEDKEAEWGIAIVPESEGSMHGRVVFPRKWWGLRESELQEMSGITGAKFVHRSGDFMAVAYSKKSAIEMAEKTLAYFDEHNKG